MLLNDVAAEDVDYIEFSCPVNIAIHYNQLNGPEQATELEPAKDFVLDDIDFPSFYMMIALNGNTGELQKITWKVYTK